MNMNEALNIDLQGESCLNPDQEQAILNKENQINEQNAISPRINSEEQLKQMRERAEAALRQDIMLRQRGEVRRDKSQAEKKPTPAEQDRLFNVRRSFQEALNKISNNDTKDVGFNAAKRIIESNADQQSLRIFLSLLCEKHKNATTSNKELQVILFGHLAQVYKMELLDPLDKPPSLLKTVVRVCESIHAFLKENSSIIHLACANSLVQILDNCFPQKNDKLTLSLIFYEPLAAVINGGYDNLGQMASSLCLQHLFTHLIQQKEAQLLDFLAPKFVQLFIRSRCDTPEMMMCLSAVVDNTNLQYVTDCLNEVVTKCLKIVEGTDTQGYLRKIEACNLLKLLAVKLKDTADLVIGYMHQQVLTVLDKSQKGDRVLKVRQAALKTKQQWMLIKGINNEMEGKKMNEELKNLSPRQLIQARTGYADINDMRQQVLKESEEAIIQSQKKARPQTAQIEAAQKQILRSSSTKRHPSPKKFKMLKELARLNGEFRTKKAYSPSQQEKDKQFESNWGAASRGQSYLKRKDGTGGGNIPGYDGKQEKRKLGTANIQRQSIRDIIAEHMKGKVGSLDGITPQDLQKYGSGDIEIYDVLKKQYEEEKKNLEREMGEEGQAFAERNLKQERVQMAGKKFDEGSGAADKDENNESAFFEEESRSNTHGDEQINPGSDRQSKPPRVPQVHPESKYQRGNTALDQNEFFREESIGKGDSGMAPPNPATTSFQKQNSGFSSQPKIDLNPFKAGSSNPANDSSYSKEDQSQSQLQVEGDPKNIQEQIRAKQFISKQNSKDQEFAQSVINEILSSDQKQQNLTQVQENQKENHFMSNDISFSKQNKKLEESHESLQRSREHVQREEDLIRKGNQNTHYNEREGQQQKEQQNMSTSQKVDQILQEYDQKQASKEHQQRQGMSEAEFVQKTFSGQQRESNQQLSREASREYQGNQLMNKNQFSQGTTLQPTMHIDEGVRQPMSGIYTNQENQAINRGSLSNNTPQNPYLMNMGQGYQPTFGDQQIPDNKQMEKRASNSNPSENFRQNEIQIDQFDQYMKTPLSQLDQNFRSNGQEQNLQYPQKNQQLLQQEGSNEHFHYLQNQPNSNLGPNLGRNQFETQMRQQNDNQHLLQAIPNENNQAIKGQGNGQQYYQGRQFPDQQQQNPLGLQNQQQPFQGNNQQFYSQSPFNGQRMDQQQQFQQLQPRNNPHQNFNPLQSQTEFQQQQFPQVMKYQEQEGNQQHFNDQYSNQDQRIPRQNKDYQIRHGTNQQLFKHSQFQGQSGFQPPASQNQAQTLQNYEMGRNTQFQQHSGQFQGQYSQNIDGRGGQQRPQSAFKGQTNLANQSLYGNQNQRFQLQQDKQMYGNVQRGASVTNQHIDFYDQYQDQLFGQRTGAVVTHKISPMKIDYQTELHRLGITVNQQSSTSLWQLGIMEQLQQVGNFMDFQFKSLDKKLKTVNFKIEETKYGIMKKEMQRESRLGSPRKDQYYIKKNKLPPSTYY